MKKFILTFTSGGYANVKATSARAIAQDRNARLKKIDDRTWLMYRLNHSRIGTIVESR